MKWKMKVAATNYLSLASFVLHLEVVICQVSDVYWKLFVTQSIYPLSKKEKKIFVWAKA